MAADGEVMPPSCPAFALRAPHCGEKSQNQDDGTCGDHDERPSAARCQVREPVGERVLVGGRRDREEHEARHREKNDSPDHAAPADIRSPCEIFAAEITAVGCDVAFVAHCPSPWSWMLTLS